MTDAAILATNVDGVLMMVRFGETKRDQVAHAVGTLQDVGAPLLGAVFTMTPPRGTASYSYNYYTYGEMGTPSASDDHRRGPKVLRWLGRNRSAHHRV